MAKLPIDDALYVKPPASPLVEATLGLIQELVRDRLHESGLGWNDFTMAGADDLLTSDDFAAIEARLRASGHRFDWSASISVAERPDA